MGEWYSQCVSRLPIPLLYEISSMHVKEKQGYSCIHDESLTT